MDKYLHYTSEELAQDSSFIHWVQKKKYDDTHDWDTWINDHPDKQDVISEAQKMVKSLKFIESPIDSNVKQVVWERINEQTKPSNHKKNPPVIRRLIWGAAAAIVLILLFNTYFVSTDVELQTSFAQNINQELPDGSNISINSKSLITYNEKDWKNNREIELNGEAFFEVKKGSSFKVLTPNGTVTVLGTSFNVFSRDNDLIVQCETGKVSVVSQNKETILTANQAVHISNGKHDVKELITSNNFRSQWKNGIYSFNNAKITSVIKELERQLDLKIIIDNKLLDQSYTGSFNVSDKEKALYEVFWPLNLDYEVKGKEVIVNN